MTPLSHKLRLLLLLPFACTAAAQDEPEPIYGTVSTTSLNLTLGEVVPGLFKKGADGKILKGKDLKPIPDFETTWSSTTGSGEKKVVTTTTEIAAKIKSSKYSTKEFLIDLVRVGILEGSIDTPATTNEAIKGWSLVLVKATLSEGIDFDETEPMLFAYKKGEDPVNLSRYAGVFTGDAYGAFNQKIVVKEKGTETVTTTEEVSYSRATQSMGNMSFTLGDHPGTPERYISIVGGYTGSAKLVKTKDQRLVVVNGPSKLSPAVGTGSYEEGENSSYYMITGSVSFGAGVVTPDIVGLFGNALIEEEF